MQDQDLLLRESMRELSKLKFNIVYTPTTVKYLQLFIFSLLKWLKCSFRLVANGCSVEEMRVLQTLCHNNSRLDFLTIPSKKMVKHGPVLSYLQTLEQSDTFCFMDSDILAVGDFLSEQIPCVGKYAGVFSGSPVFRKIDEQTLTEIDPKITGRFNQTATGICLGSTHLAIYDNQVLTQMIQSTGIDFDRYDYADVPTQYQGWLAERGLKKARYDTGKLLNLLLLAQGEQLVFIESPCLLHIGGISMQLLRERDEQDQKMLRKKSIAQWSKNILKQAIASLGMKKPTTHRAVTIDVKLRSRIFSFR